MRGLRTARALPHAQEPKPKLYRWRIMAMGTPPLGSEGGAGKLSENEEQGYGLIMGRDHRGGPRFRRCRAR